MEANTESVGICSLQKALANLWLNKIHCLGVGAANRGGLISKSASLALLILLYLVGLPYNGGIWGGCVANWHCQPEVHLLPLAFIQRDLYAPMVEESKKGIPDCGSPLNLKD